MSEPFDNQGPGLPPPVPPPPPPPPRSGSPFLPPTQPVYAATDTMPTAVTPTTPVEVALTPSPAPPRRSKGKMFGAIAGVVVLLGAGTFAVAKISSNDNSGGAASPEELGRKLIDAAENEDVLGAVDLLLPGERETFRQPLIDLVDELRRLEVFDDTADLNKVAGFDITIDDEDISIDDSNVDDISKVSITGTSTLTVDGDKVPIGDLVTDLSPEGERPDLSSEEENDDFNLSFAAVEKDGRWYVSLFYSAAESARGDRDIPEEGVVPDGADSPEGALDNMLTSLGDLDLEGLIGGLNPNEAEALQRYAPLFIDDAQAELDDLDADIDVSGGEYEVTGSGDRRQVAVRALTVDITADGETTTFKLEDGCVTGQLGDEEFNSCDEQQDVSSAIEDYFSSLGIDDTTAISDLIDDASAALQDFSMNGIVVDKVHGEWYVSPIGTYLELQLSVLRALDRDELETLIDDVQKVIDSFATVDDSYDTGTDDTGTDDTGTDDTGTDDVNAGYYECLGLPNEEAQACVTDGIASGAYDPHEVPAPYQYPQCGLFEYYNSEAIYTDTPEDFLATIGEGAQCIVDAAAADGLDLTLSTPEFVKPECFVDVNPYDFSGSDPDALSKAYECAYTG
jgi:hypothetical protein